MEHEDFEVIDRTAEGYEQALQLLAVLIRRLGGEVTISRREFEMLEGLPVMGRHITPDHLRLRLYEPHEYEAMGAFGEPDYAFDDAT